MIHEEAIRQCRQIIAEGSTSFSLASRLLPRRSRNQAIVLYSWCRRADDAVDCVPCAEAEGALERLRREVEDVYAGRRLDDAILRALAATVAACRIPRLYPDELIAGLEMDARGMRYDTREQLLHYCYRVAGTVGLMMCHIMGVRDQSATRNAAHLGVAMQLTNICRDVAEDWQRGRLYLPNDLLREVGADGLCGALGRELPTTAEPAVRRAVEALLDLADGYYASGDAGARELPLRCELAVRAARLIYSAIGTRLQAQGFDPLVGRAVVPDREKLTLLRRALVTTLGSLPDRVASAAAIRRPPSNVLTFEELASS